MALHRAAKHEQRVQKNKSELSEEKNLTFSSMAFKHIIGGKSPNPMEATERGSRCRPTGWRPGDVMVVQ